MLSSSDVAGVSSRIAYAGWERHTDLFHRQPRQPIVEHRRDLSQCTVGDLAGDLDT